MWTGSFPARTTQCGASFLGNGPLVRARLFVKHTDLRWPLNRRASGPAEKSPGERSPRRYLAFRFVPPSDGCRIVSKPEAIQKRASRKLWGRVSTLRTTFASQKE